MQAAPNMFSCVILNLARVALCSTNLLSYCSPCEEVIVISVKKFCLYMHVPSCFKNAVQREWLVNFFLIKLFSNKATCWVANSFSHQAGAALRMAWFEWACLAQVSVILFDIFHRPLSHRMRLKMVKTRNFALHVYVLCSFDQMCGCTDQIEEHVRKL